MRTCIQKSDTQRITARALVLEPELVFEPEQQMHLSKFDMVG